MKVLRGLSIAVLCVGLALNGGSVSASDWQLPTIGTTIPGGIPSQERQYIVYFNAIDVDTGEELVTEGLRSYEWYIPVYMAYTPSVQTKRVRISYRLAEWDGGIEGQWVDVTDIIEKEIDVDTGWNYIFLPLAGVGMDYTIGICKQEEDPIPDEEKSDNNYLASIEVERGTLVPTFNPETTAYSLQLDEDVDELTIHVKTQDEKASVTQETIITPLSKGENRIGITVKAENGSNRYYYIMVMCGNGESTADDKENNKTDSGSSGSQGRYNTSRDLSNFSKVTHVATKVSTTGIMIANSGLTAEQAVAGLTVEQKEQIISKLRQKIPYTTLAYALKEAEIKSATQNIFTDEQISQILASPELITQLGINLNDIVKTVTLKSTGISSYSDLNENDTSKTAIEEALSLGVLEATEDGKFYPESSIKFEDACKFLDRTLLLNHIETMKLGRSTVELYFEDINMVDYPYIGSVASKLQVKTTKILANKQLDEGLARQEMAQIIYEVTEGKLETNNEEVYIADIGDNTYEPALTYAVKSGLMTLANDCIIPSENITKAETIEILMRLNKAIQNMQALEAQEKEEIAKNNVITDPANDPLTQTKDE